MVRKSILFTLIFLFFGMQLKADEFQKLWYDGNAEISVYDLSEVRYDEKRNGKRIMVFVTEPLSLKTLIKPDTRLPENLKIDVIKLNDIRKFTTGIYDYSIMTSVFSSVDKRKKIPLLSTIKVNFSSQEWCGNVFEILKRVGNQFLISHYSYFESEGDQNYKINIDNRIEPEDNLWILIRELRGPFLGTGESIELGVIASSWYRRKNHRKVSKEKAYINKTLAGNISTGAGRFKANLFSWKIKNRETRVWVEKDYPHRILKWIEPDGTKGTLSVTSRKPYWKQHDNKHEYLRDKLGIGASNK